MNVCLYEYFNIILTSLIQFCQAFALSTYWRHLTRIKKVTLSTSIYTRVPHIFISMSFECWKLAHRNSIMSFKIIQTHYHLSRRDLIRVCLLYSTTYWNVKDYGLSFTIHINNGVIFVEFFNKTKNKEEMVVFVKI